MQRGIFEKTRNFSGEFQMNFERGIFKITEVLKKALNSAKSTYF